MNKGKVLKDLFTNKKYPEVIEALENVYCNLFEEMLEYKNATEPYKDYSYRELKVLIKDYYPDYYNNITILDTVSSIPYYSYLDIINTYLDMYNFFKNDYKK